MIEDLNSIASKILSIPLDLNEDETMNEIVEIVHSTLNFFYVGLYLTDFADEFVLRAGSGEIGKALLSHGHRRSTKSTFLDIVVTLGKICLVNQNGDVFCYSPLPEFQAQTVLIYQRLPNVVFPSPLIPRTVWQIFIPIQKQNETIGLLEFHSDRFTNFISEEIEMLRLVANQIVVKLNSN